MPDRREGDHGVVELGSVLRSLALLPGAELPHIGVAVDSVDRHDEVEAVDNDGDRGHRQPPLAEDDERLLGQQVILDVVVFRARVLRLLCLVLGTLGGGFFPAVIDSLALDGKFSLSLHWC